MSETPERIYLQKPLHEDNWNESTWREEQVEHDDIEYVRADRLTALEAEIKALREALRDCVNFMENTESELGITLSSADRARSLLAKGDGR